MTLGPQIATQRFVPFEYSAVAHRVIGCAIEVHRELGPGLLESPYDECLARAMIDARLRFQRQVILPLHFQNGIVLRAYKVDFVVESQLLVEVKSVQQLLKIHRDQTLTYMKLAGTRYGLLINSNVTLLKYGIVSLLNPRAARQA